MEKSPANQNNKEKSRREFTAEFKREALNLVESSGKSVPQVAKELGISDSILYRWQKLQAENGDQAFPGKGHQAPQDEELRRLRQEVENLRQERDILKKAVVIFARNPR